MQAVPARRAVGKWYSALESHTGPVVAAKIRPSKAITGLASATDTGHAMFSITGTMLAGGTGSVGRIGVDSILADWTSPVLVRYSGPMLEAKCWTYRINPAIYRK